MANAVIIDGKAVAQKVRNGIKERIESLKAANKRIPCLAVILVGNDPASAVYVRNKMKACAEVGMLSEQVILPADTSEETLLDAINKFNCDENVDGILVQLPLPRHIDAQKVTKAILPSKDADAFHPLNVGLSRLGEPAFTPCTPSGVIRLLDEYGIEISGKRCVVIGRSNIVGKPVADMLLARNGTVTVCHSKTPDIAEYTKNADIIVVAVGRAKMLKGDMIKDGCTVIDVGINRVDGKLCGDCDFDSCAEKAAYITPVPGGVGPMTIAMLLENTMRAYELK
ncbi:MAG: bifunctional methylenetetrahydrofolate dehydrogenase/methenyltetrahydrofolate cyclohydrolase FolD [Clostridia bacterium]|nr:bifunctional methylenetetrahydrofolate dehydrogenase/methenyltetrahydrofolate cyclohydrolase FolD [Clostridia bacterium]